MSLLRGDAWLISPKGISAEVRGEKSEGEEKRHGHAPKGTETPVSCRVEDCRVSWMDTTSSSSLPLRMQQRWPCGLSPGTCTTGKCHMGASTGCCFARLLQSLSLVPQLVLCGSATTPGTLPSPASAAGVIYTWVPACPPLLWDAAPAPGRAEIPPHFSRTQRERSVLEAKGEQDGERDGGWEMGGVHPAAGGWLPSCNRRWEHFCKPCRTSRHQLSLSGGQRWV